MKSRIALIATFILCVFFSPCFLQQKTAHFPEFEFDIWGSAPPKIVALTKERPVQKILFVIKEKALSTKEIAEKIGENGDLVLEKLGELEQHDVVLKEDGKWLSNIPLYVEKEIREAEKIGQVYAEKEAGILRKEILAVKRLYGRTMLGRYFPWDVVSLRIMGAFLADFCVIDRLPFRPENFNKEMQPPLGKEGEKKWGYVGYEILPKRYPSRKWAFYQNVTSTYEGGTARFGYFRYPDEQRKSPPRRPEGMAGSAQSKVLFALADRPLDLKELEAQSGLNNEILVKVLDELMSYDPPAIIRLDGKYQSKIPVLAESDFNLLLPELDRVAEKIYKDVVIPHLKERKERARELRYRWPFPADTYVRDKALGILVEEGLLTSVQPPPVDWNFGVWGWKGFLRMHDQVTKNPKPDGCLSTSFSILKDTGRNKIRFRPDFKVS